jgi:glutaredoxin
MHPITVYTKDGCSRCESAKNQLKSMNVDYREVVVGRDVPRARVLEHFPEITQLPIIVEDGKVVTIEDLK